MELAAGLQPPGISLACSCPGPVQPFGRAVSAAWESAPPAPSVLPAGGCLRAPSWHCCVGPGLQLSVLGQPCWQHSLRDASCSPAPTARLCGVGWRPWGTGLARWGQGVLCHLPELLSAALSALPTSPGSPLVLFSVVPSLVQRMQAPLGDWQLLRSNQVSDAIQLLEKENKALQSCEVGAESSPAL